MLLSCVYVFFNNTGTSEIYTLSLHDALPILVPWEQMGFARYDARTNEMALIADTALPTGEPSGRFDADVGLTGEAVRSEEHTSELQSRQYLVCRLLLEKKKKIDVE